MMDNVQAFEKPCRHCAGSGTRFNANIGLLVMCDECDGTGIESNISAAVISSVYADLKAAQEHIAALETENARLIKALSIIGNTINLTKYATEIGIDCSQHTNPATTMCAIAREVLQPAKEAE